jgi:hypothetical protein
MKYTGRHENELITAHGQAGGRRELLGVRVLAARAPHHVRGRACPRRPWSLRVILVSMAWTPGEARYAS